jgi:hypothetical protein
MKSRRRLIPLALTLAGLALAVALTLELCGAEEPQTDEIAHVRVL